MVTVPSGTVDDSELVTDGLVFKPGHFVAKTGGPEKVDDAKIGLIQFCISPPKTDMDNKVVINDSAQVDRILREERQYILNICKKIKASGCNVLLIQKSILRYVSEKHLPMTISAKCAFTPLAHENLGTIY